MHAYQMLRNMMHAYVIQLTNMVLGRSSRLIFDGEMGKEARLALGGLAVAAVLFLTYYTEDLRSYALSTLGTGWMTAYLIPRAVLVFLVTLLLTVCWPLFAIPRRGKVVLSVLITGVCVGGYLIVNLPFIDDWNKKGEELSGVYPDNAVELILQEEFLEFEGVVFMALPNCPYCFQAYPDLKVLKQRNPQMDVATIVFGQDATRLEFFREHVGESDIPVFLLEDHQQATTLTQGKYPAYLYVRGGKVMYRWSNNQFGYPALDWVEQGLDG